MSALGIAAAILKTPFVNLIQHSPFLNRVFYREHVDHEAQRKADLQNIVDYIRAQGRPELEPIIQYLIALHDQIPERIATKTDESLAVILEGRDSGFPRPRS